MRIIGDNHAHGLPIFGPHVRTPSSDEPEGVPNFAGEQTGGTKGVTI